MKDFQNLKKNLKKDFSKFKSIKLAILGDSSTQLLNQSIKGAGYEYNLNIEIWEADYNQIEQQVSDTTSNLYSFNPEFIFITLSSNKLLEKYNKLNPSNYDNLAANELSFIDYIYTTLQERLTAKIIFTNYNEINDSIFGNYATKTSTSFLFQLRELNYKLMKFSSIHPNLFICDVSSIQNSIGRNTFFHSKTYLTIDMVYSFDALPLIAYRTLDILSSLLGNFKKCLILDLDNTIWGGIIGDDGIENIQIGNLGIGKAFSNFQYWVKKLKNRGIIIAICSKNNENTAKKPFKHHPEMVLNLEDIAVFTANWDNKVDNIRHIQSVLNINFDSMVFIDDNPFERNIVRENIPSIFVPELPDDPALYLDYLYELNLFETTSFSSNDLERTQQYKIEIKRNQEFQKFKNEDDFLKNLQMESEVKSLTSFNIPRVSQLSQRSNQFNLRTIRYTENELEKISISDKDYCISFTLKDKYGDNGLISAILLKELDQSTIFIENWFMSCRVLKRGMEHFILNTIVEFATEKKYKTIKGEYIPTPKNELVKDLFINLGFAKSNNDYILNLENYQPKKNYILSKK